MVASITLRRFERSLVFVIGVAVGVVASTLVASSGGITLPGSPASPAASSGPIGVTSIRFMESPGDSLCAVLADWSVRCAGEEGWGELTPPQGVAFRDVVPGRETSCGVTVDGETVCWGMSSGTVRAGGTVDRIVTYMESGLCVIDSSQRLVCFQDPSIVRAEPISMVGVQNISGLSNWYLTFCGLDAQATAVCFNADGSRIGDAQRYTAPKGLVLQVIRLGQESACGLDLAGEVRCWGRAGSVAEAPSGPFVDVALRYEYACGLRADGTVTCWGTGSRTAQPPREARFSSIALSAWSEIACGVTTRGQAVCWGPGMSDRLQQSLATW